MSAIESAIRPPADSTEILARLRGRLIAARAETDALFELVRPEFLFERPIAERHRLVFYIGHLEAFDCNLLAELLDERSAERELDALFAFGIDPIDGHLPQDTPTNWPRLPEIRAYCDRARVRIDAALARASDTPPRLQTLLHAAIEHRLMHAETLSYLLHQLPFAYKRGDVAVPHEESSPLVAARVRVAAGDTTLGLAHDSAAFGWDNELPAHTVAVPAFSIDTYKVTNRQYLAFVAAGGYADRALWSDADWAWRDAHGVEHPAFWIRDGETWRWKSMFAAIPLPLDAPVYVSHAEASAYARWAGRPLPSEAQWQRAAFGDATQDAHAAALSDLSLQFDPLPAHARALVPSFSGAIGMRGNGWEWTRTPFAPLPGFAAFDFYRGYSAPFFDGRHYVLKGGSPRTAPCLLRPSFRNWFQAHYPYVYAGFRLMDDEQGGTA